jgi:hypothetical protein
MTTKTTTTFRVGDRVRVNHFPDDILVFTSCVRVARYGYHGDAIPMARFANGQEARFKDCELVERAHYAAPGAPMMALTPELREAIETAALAYSEFCGIASDECNNHVRIISEAIAAAQKEV